MQKSKILKCFISVLIDQSEDTCDFKYYYKVTTYSETNHNFMDEKIYCESDVLNPSYCDAIAEEDETIPKAKARSDHNCEDKGGEPDELNAKEKSTIATQGGSDLYYDSRDDSDKKTCRFKMGIDNLADRVVVTQQPVDLMKLTTDQSINVKRCHCHKSIFFLLSSLILTVTIIVINIVFFFFNIDFVRLSSIRLFRSTKCHLC